jgi:hypothetical protein
MMHPVPDRPNAAANAEDTSRWRLPDLLDFDYYVDRDEERLRADPGERKRLTERDRRLYSERIAPRIDAAEHTPEHRSAALRRWLGIRRGAEDPSLQALLPGSAFARGPAAGDLRARRARLLRRHRRGRGLLQYDGERPVNVSWYLFVLVLLQVLLLGGTAIGVVRAPLAGDAGRRAGPVAARASAEAAVHPAPRAGCSASAWPTCRRTCASRPGAKQGLMAATSRSTARRPSCRC